MENNKKAGDVATNTSNVVMINEFRESMADFHEAMKAREALSIRIGKRTTQILRISLVGMASMGVIMFFLIWTLLSDMQSITKHMRDMSGYMETMHSDFTAVRDDMSIMRKGVTSMDAGVQQMSHDMTQLNTSVYNISGGVTDMTRDVNQMSSPMKFFPFN